MPSPGAAPSRLDLLDDVDDPAVWGDVVATALLGTDRRTLPERLPVGWGRVELGRPAHEVVLALAAQHRSWARAGARPGASAGPADTGWPPPDPRPLAPAEAQQQLSPLLGRAAAGLVSWWLDACLAVGRRPSPGSWVGLATLAARTVSVSRPQLSAALGAQGRRFVAQNPEWARLHAQLLDEIDTAQAREWDDWLQRLRRSPVRVALPDSDPRRAIAVAFGFVVVAPGSEGFGHG